MAAHGYDWVRITGDTRVYVGPVDFAGLILAADGVGTADATVYDGRDAGGRQFTTFRTPVSRTEPHGPPVPAFFGQGLFINVGSNVEEVVVLYRSANPAHPRLRPLEEEEEEEGS